MDLENFNQEELLREIKNCFTKKELEQLAKESKFIRRNTSRLTGTSFLLMNVFDTTDGKERSLNDSCDWLEEHLGISMTKQSLDERYNAASVSYLKMCFNRVLQIVNKDLLNRKMDLPFSKIQLTDSTSFKIPSNLSSFYKGYAGKGGKAVLKMHLNYDFLTGSVEDIFLTDGTKNDNTYKLGRLEQIIANALYIRDLGYYDLTQFIKIDNAGAYFLSRGKTDAVYNIKNDKGEYTRIDLAAYLPRVGQVKELTDIYVGGNKNKVKVRLILEGVPKKVAQQRLKRLEANASKSKYPVSEQRKSMCYFNVYITNAPAESLPTSFVRLIYTIRWQIELIFKIWKSVFKIDKVRKMNIFRFESYIYSKLIAILLTLNIHNKLGQYLWDEYDFELSPMKAAKLIKKNSTD